MKSFPKKELRQKLRSVRICKHVTNKSLHHKAGSKLLQFKDSTLGFSMKTELPNSFVDLCRMYICQFTLCLSSHRFPNLERWECLTMIDYYKHYLRESTSMHVRYLFLSWIVPRKTFVPKSSKSHDTWIGPNASPVLWLGDMSVRMKKTL